jgi:hypothetical protein
MGRISKQEKEGKGSAAAAAMSDATHFDPTLPGPTDKISAISAHLNSSLTLRHLIDASTCRPLTKCDSSKILPKTTYSKCYLNSPLETHLIVLGLIRDRTYQLFVDEQRRLFAMDINRAKRMIRSNVRENPQACSVSVEEMIAATANGLITGYNNVFNFCAQLPGLNQLSESDVHRLVKSKFFCIYGFFINCVYINGECYLTLPGDVQVTRRWSNLIMGPEITQRQFDYQEKISEFTETELALLIPYSLTMGVNGNS